MAMIVGWMAWMDISRPEFGYYSTPGSDQIEPRLVVLGLLMLWFIVVRYI